MSSNLYCSEVVQQPKQSFYELKFLFRRIFETDCVDEQLSVNQVPILKAALAASTDEEIVESLGGIIVLLEQGKILHFKEEH